MTPEEELKRLNKLIRQYETVFRTTSDPSQRERVERQLKELRGYREQLLAVNVIDTDAMDETEEEEDTLAGFPLLALLQTENAAAPRTRALATFARKDAPQTSVQEEMFNLALYSRHFETEFLPFLTEKHLKLDFKFSMDRDSFYRSFNTLQRKMADYRDENQRMAEGAVSRDMELEMRKRGQRLIRLIEVEAAKFFRAIERFCVELLEDAAGDGVKCLNGDGQIKFDAIEGQKHLEGRTVRDALEEMGALAAEAIAYLNIPEIETQESERADRH